ncbi:hypothetical protein F5884DRAFT_209759 [Xylogone sp. PMI_703]|nr:hypothetical protein F5884DRAFT_209759 [Xylogone sp. PMI_703]
MPTQLSDLPHASAGASVLAAPGDFVRSKFTSVSNKNCVNSLYHPSSSIPHESNRPTSTPVYSTDNTSLAVPPRRTLPFARPHTAAPKMTSESHQNTAPPPHARTNLTVQEENSPLAAKALTSVPNSALSGLKSKETTTRKRNSTPANGRQPASKRPKMISQSTQTQAISGHSHAAGLGHACSNEMTENGDANHLGVSPVFAGYLQRLFTIVNKQDTTLSPKEIWEIPRYTDGDDEVREMILNDFICANLEDKDFQKLCEDIEHAWRRVGLGM